MRGVRSPGTGWFGEESDEDSIDWVIRRPEKHLIASNSCILGVLHAETD